MMRIRPNRSLRYPATGKKRQIENKRENALMPKDSLMGFGLKSFMYMAIHTKVRYPPADHTTGTKHAAARDLRFSGKKAILSGLVGMGATSSPSS
mmetsp:Transcript_9183/g.25417  ORF Transcript_9183/g.25417 Transcript_9183/m.25417 type:complete len:95 (+) Transcript_9183:2092-2376(+)